MKNRHIICASTLLELLILTALLALAATCVIPTLGRTIAWLQQHATSRP